jgi:hypothetical protein
MNGLSRAGAVALAAQVVAEWPLPVSVVCLGMELPCEYAVMVELSRREVVIISTYEGFSRGIGSRAMDALNAIQKMERHSEPLPGQLELRVDGGVKRAR